MTRGIVLYATKYGSTQEIAESLADKLEFQTKNVADICEDSELEQYDVIILGTPIYFDDIFEDMKHFVTSYFIKLGDKKFAWDLPLDSLVPAKISPLELMARALM